MGKSLQWPHLTLDAALCMIVVAANCYLRANADSQQLPGYADLCAHQTNNGTRKSPGVGLRGFAVDQSFQPYAAHFAIALTAAINCGPALMKV